MMIDTTIARRAAELADEPSVQLAALNERLRDLDELKDDFMASVSQAVVRRNTEHLLGLVRDLLFLTQLDDGSVALDLGPVDADALVRRAILTVAPEAEAKGLRLVLDLDSPDPVVADADQLLLVVQSLLANAVRFTAHGGEVEVRTITTWDGGWAFEVADGGIGIPAEDLPNVFGRFSRAANANLSGEANDDLAAPGLGLGLAIAKAIVELNGGLIGVESEEGVGSTFCVALPRSPDAVDLTAWEVDPV